MSGASVMVAVTVPADPARAFELFTQDIGLWWGKGRAFEFNPGRGGILRFEPGPDGRLVEAYPGGQVYEIGRVTAWEPGRRLAFEWRLPTFRAGQVTRVEVSFRAVDAGTRVTVEHGGWGTIPPDHPARHGLPATAHGQQVGAFWRTLLQRLSRLA
ncbi:MAG: SRPBCC domain-containing protein [Alphaproteobacteria bacterium]